MGRAQGKEPRLPVAGAGGGVATQGLLWWPGAGEGRCAHPQALRAEFQREGIPPFTAGAPQVGKRDTRPLTFPSKEGLLHLL